MAFVPANRKQREALFRVFQRSYPNWVSPGRRISHTRKEEVRTPTILYRKFRRTVQPCFDGSGCIMVPYANMWLGIETDGYTHS